MGSVKFLPVACLWMLLGFQSVYAQNTIKVNQPTDGNGRYAVAMAQLALSKLDTKYTFDMIPSDGTQARTLDEVASGKLDLFWTATDAELESILLPIRIPLYKGLLGHRIFLIRKGDQARFDNVRSFDDLKQFTFGQGTTWADTKILEANGLKVIKTMKYESLFHMLDGGRFDAFPRGVQEPWAELDSHGDLDLVDEKRLMLVYRMPFYLLTSPANRKLAADLELGFNRAIADGSFDKVFFSSPLVQAVMERANLEKRMVFELKNPNLPKETPVDRAELWLNINELKNQYQKSIH